VLKHSSEILRGKTAQLTDVILQLLNSCNS
jgi:hypothetical protein